MYLLFTIGTVLLSVLTLGRVTGTAFESGWFSDILPPGEQSPEVLSSMRDLIPQYLYDLYEDMRYQDDGLDPAYRATSELYHHGQAIRTFRVRDQKAAQGVWRNIRREMKFNLSRIPQQANITAAEFVLPVKNFSRVSQHTRVFHNNVRLQKTEATHHGTRYVVYNISTIFNSTGQNNSVWFQIVASYFHSIHDNVLGDVFYLDQAVLVIYENIDPNSLVHARSRRRRQVTRAFTNSFLYHVLAMDNATSSGRTRTVPPDSTGCRLRPWNINLATLSWYWVLQPTEYNANQCSGECMSSPESITSNYGIIKSQFHTHTAFQYTDTVSLPSCTPSRMTAISIIYYTDMYVLIAKRLPEMKVTQCDCR